jgi:hypothetical protein
MILNNIVTNRLESVEVAESTPDISPSAGNVDVDSTVETSSIRGRAFTPGISPASAVPERTHTSAVVINSRFIDCLLLSLRTM